MTVLVVCAHINATGIILSVAEAELRARAATSVNEAVITTFSGGVGYDDLVSVERDGEGNIRAITSDALEINRLARVTAYSAQAILREMCEEDIAIPLGAFTGIKAWAGFGPQIGMKIIPVSSVTCRFTSDFQTAGINQTRHSVYLEISADMSVVMPAATREFTSVTQVLIAESVLVGDVPQVYLQGNLFGNGYTLTPAS